MKRVIILLGPTGVGKTGASLLLAEELGTEIISADSMQIYRGMDIGTAKPTREEQTAIRHHMIDVADPSESYSTGRYIREIVRIIEDLHSQGKIPLVVGGTGLYIKAITRGIFSGPSADWSLRDELIAMEQEEKGCLHAYLSKVDPEAAGKIERNDLRRTVRALEVCIKSREKISAMQERCTMPLPYEFVKIGITRDRSELYRMIDARVDSMVKAGLIEEVARLLRANPDRTPLQAIGYKEIASHLRGEVPLEEAVRLVKRNTRRYAKRQISWFRTEAAISWADVTGFQARNDIFRAVKAVYLRLSS